MNHIKDTREPIFRKIGKRYVECGKVDSPYADGCNWESNKKDGLWLHTSGEFHKAMSFICSLEELKLPAIQIAAMHLLKEQLAHAIVQRMYSPFSPYELAKYVTDFICNQKSE
jgi:hypothetical protein